MKGLTSSVPLASPWAAWLTIRAGLSFPNASYCLHIFPKFLIE
jgi:hypothetical protein